MLKNKINNNGAITLIALVITIIVLLILAGISISMLTGENSILKRATEAKEVAGKAQVIEEVKTEILAQIAENKGENISEEQLKNILKKYFVAEEVDSLEFGESLAEHTGKITTLNGEYKIDVVDIYNGSIKAVVPGLYDSTTGALKKSWDKLLQEGIINEENGVVSTHYNESKLKSDSAEDLVGRLVFPKDITEIGYGAFRGCNGLTGELIIPNSVTSIGIVAFAQCKGLTSIVLSNNLTKINSATFLDCNGLTCELKIPDSVTQIGDAAFQNCSGLTGNLIIPNSVTSIGGAAFQRCTRLSGRLVIPNSVNLIGGCFGSCGSETENGLSSVEIDVTTIRPDNFLNIKCRSMILGEHVTTIDTGAFANVTGISGELVIKSKTATIGNSAFLGCTGLTKVNMPYVKSTGSGCFSSCSNITEIVFSKEIKSLTGGEFSNCTSLNKVYYTGTKQEWDSITGFEMGNAALSNAPNKIYEYKPEF